MHDFCHYLKALWAHWWALLSCALFTCLGTWIFYADKSNYWSLRATFGLAGICLLSASFLIWKDEHKRALQAEKSLEAPLISGRDWEQMAEKMTQTCQFISLLCNWTDNTDRAWFIQGGDHSGSCRAWLSRAGKMLIESPNVSLEVPQAVRNEPDDFFRWGLYLEHRGHLRPDIGQVMYDKTPRDHNSGTIDDVGRLSALIFMEFAAMEIQY